MEKNESILLLIFSTENEKIAKTRNKIEFLLKNLMKTRRDIINCDITVISSLVFATKRERKIEKK